MCKDERENVQIIVKKIILPIYNFFFFSDKQPADE